MDTKIIITEDNMVKLLNEVADDFLSKTDNSKEQELINNILFRVLNEFGIESV